MNRLALGGKDMGLLQIKEIDSQAMLVGSDGRYATSLCSAGLVKYYVRLKLDK
jgi:hypothetical protein